MQAPVAECDEDPWHEKDDVEKVRARLLMIGPPSST